MAVMTISTTSSACAADLQGRVVGITDGDTLRLLVGNHIEYKIRLGEIDAPESGQPYGRASKQILSDLAFGKTVTVRVTDVDRYGRSVAVITRGKLSINAEMVRRGGAWAYRRYLSDQRYVLWEAEARQARRGLWGLQPDQIMAPWDWRASRRGASKSSGSKPATSIGYQARAFNVTAMHDRACGVNWQCRQMSSCDEASYQLRVCGSNRLDGDGDGVPCEKLCR
jgi:endonuclease YncB( thermonuclease family)